MKKAIGNLIVALALSGVAVYPWGVGDMSLDPRLRPFAVLFGSAWTLRRVVVFGRAWSRWRSWRQPATWSLEAEDLPFESTRRWIVRPLAKWFHSHLSSKAARWMYPDKGILLGRAFRWSPEHTQELETYLQGGKPLPVGRDARGGYPALHAVGRREEQPLVLPWSELVGHVLIGGTTRSGKTRLLEVILSEAIRGPGTVIVIDPKGDAELLIRAATEAHRSGREFAFFSPAHADHSASFNPFSMCTNTTELAARVQALMPGGGGMAKGDPFFTEYPLAVVERLGAAQEAVGDEWTIEGLHAVTTMVPPFEDLVSRYLYQVLGGRDDWAPSLEDLMAEYARSRGEKQDALADALVDDKEKPRDHFVQVTANLVPAFRGVTGGKMARLLSSADPDLTWDGVVAQRKVVYFAMSSLLYGEVANRIGRVILQDLIGFLGDRYAFNDPAAMTPLTILIDEFSNVAYPGFIDALNKGGGAKANIMLAMQSLADPEAAMGKDGTQRVLDNLNTRVWFRLTDDATAKLAVEGLGMTSVSREDISHSLSFGGKGGTSGGSRGAMQYTDRSLVRSEWVTGLPRGEAFVRTRGENWKLRMPLLKPVGKEELREAAGRYGLAGVLAELREQAEARGSETDNERRLGARKNGRSTGAGKGTGAGTGEGPGDTRGRSAPGTNASQARDGKHSESAAGLTTAMDRLGAATSSQSSGEESDGEGVVEGAENTERSADRRPEPPEVERRPEAAPNSDAGLAPGAEAEPGTAPEPEAVSEDPLGAVIDTAHVHLNGQGEA